MPLSNNYICLFPFHRLSVSPSPAAAISDPLCFLYLYLLPSLLENSSEQAMGLCLSQSNEGSKYSDAADANTHRNSLHHVPAFRPWILHP
jgi:hypothetical protein